jgi:abhydrolase domain-containing protein 6
MTAVVPMRRAPRRRLQRVLAGMVALVVVLVAAGSVVWFTPSLFVPLMTRVAYVALGLETGSVPVQGHAWGYLASGDPARPPLLMLHGFGTSREAMMTMMPWFRDGHRCVAPDLPGFGRHPFHTGEDHNADWYAAQVIAFADAMGWRRFDLLGTSMGGAIAAHVAVLHPDRVGRLVLVAPAGVRAPEQNGFMERIGRGENPLDITTEADFDRVLGLVFDRPPPVPWQFRSYATAEAVRTRAERLKIVESMRAFLLDGLTEELSRIRCPTLLVWGRRDRVTDPSMFRVFLERVPLATGTMIDEAGHVPFSDQPEWTRRAITAFLRSRAGGGN